MKLRSRGSRDSVGQVLSKTRTMTVSLMPVIGAGCGFNISAGSAYAVPPRVQARYPRTRAHKRKRGTALCRPPPCKPQERLGQ